MPPSASQCLAHAAQGTPLSTCTPRTSAARVAAGPMLTGNAQADADIIAFYKAREELVAGQAKAVRPLKAKA